MRRSSGNIRQHQCAERHCQSEQKLFHGEPSIKCSFSTGLIYAKIAEKL
ncbi:hypothetical protein GW12_15700 [Acinetobacter sp. HR7]|nr:hypothetical protein GW12_15700 [Acinetobacter sp. HR7]